MKKIIVLSLLITSVLLTGCTNNETPINNTKEQPTNDGLVLCPDEWIGNQMPGDMSEKGRQYYILDGKRRANK